jgi:hypothetical protein
MWGEMYEPLVYDQWQHNPFFVENRHERSFSILLKANTYIFFDKELISTRNLIMLPMARKHMLVRYMILWSMMNGHSTPSFVENSHE